MSASHIYRLSNLGLFPNPGARSASSWSGHVGSSSGVDGYRYFDLKVSEYVEGESTTNIPMEPKELGKESSSFLQRDTKGFVPYPLEFTQQTGLLVLKSLWCRGWTKTKRPQLYSERVRETLKEEFV